MSGRLLAGLSLLLLLAGVGGWWNARRAQPPFVPPVPKAERSPRLPTAASRPGTPPPPPRLAPPASPAVGLPEPETKRGVRALLAAVAGPEYEAGHPGVLERLAALLEAEAQPFESYAGAVAYLGKDLDPAQRVDLWMRAAECFPGNHVIADAMIRAAFQDGGKAEAALAAQLARTPEDPHLLWLQASLAFDKDRPEEALGFLEKSGPAGDWKDVGGLAELGALQVLEGMGEAPDPFQRLDVLLRYPRPELARYVRLAQQASDWAGQCQAQGRPLDGIRILEAVDRVGSSLERGSRSLVGFISAQSMREEALRALAPMAEATGDLVLSARIEASLRAIEEERRRFWAWDREYRREAAERLRPLYERLGMPYHRASALHGVAGLKARAGELSPAERILVDEAGTALFEEVDAYRRHD